MWRYKEQGAATGIEDRQVEKIVIGWIRQMSHLGWTRVRALMMTVAVLLTLAACGSRGDMPWPLEPGFAALIRVGGETYEMEVARVDGLLAHLEYSWKGQVIATSDVYHGLFAVSGHDEKGEFRHDIDLGEIDGLFPLAIGHTARLEGTAFTSAHPGSGRLLASFEVLRREAVRVGDHRFETFVLRVVSRLVFADGTSEQVIRTIYYAPRLGLPVRMRFESGGRTVHWQMIAVERRPRGRANRLGTVAI
ncbi:MAG: hypothetical protein D6757_09455 [Alphaproteobacteria bacterium]|nr:MAG: hypothetical protein D6757_09455 [Alphaproteobacteria bacterium]